MKTPIALPLAELAPTQELFTHFSPLHGQAHVARVMVHAFRLIDATGWIEEAPRLWAAVYLHDLARTHDGICHRHGADAMQKFERLPAVKALFTRAGVREEDYPAIKTAVVHHCAANELEQSHRHWRLTSLLKDADALDRVRIGDLDPRYLRNSEARQMLDFAHALFEQTDGMIAAGRDHFVELWPEAMRIASSDTRVFPSTNGLSHP